MFISALLLVGALAVGVAYLISIRHRSPEEKVAAAFQSWVIDTAVSGKIFTLRDSIIGFVNEKRVEAVRLRTDPLTISYLKEQLYVLECVDPTKKNADSMRVCEEWAPIVSAYENASPELKELIRKKDLESQTHQ